jgi:magnesium transporter
MFQDTFTTPVPDLTAFPPNSAGAVMTPGFVSIAPDLRADQAIDALRVVAQEAGTLFYVYVIDAIERLLGVLPLHRLVLADARSSISDLMLRDVVSVKPSDDRETAARLLDDRSLMAVPVVDDNDRLLGIVTVDAVIDAIEGEFTEDYLRLAGTDAEEMALRSHVQVARLRLPWLMGTMVIELGAGLVISRFDDVLQQVILLVTFMPVISAISGNVGLQAAAIVVRGLDTGHIQLQGWRRHVAKEFATSAILALSCGGMLGTVGAIWSGRLPFGIVIGGALTCSMLTAGFMGTAIPMLSKRLGFDPAATAGPFETAFQDVVGFAVFLWLASLLIRFLR